ncbi:hypothetical protein GCM10020220_109080 [Nonomuraea rubra]
MELGVHALEFDVALTADRRLVLTHDLTVSAVTSADRRPLHAGDPLYPYVGRPINTLTLAQLRTLDVGVRLPRHPDDPFALTQVAMPETRMPTLGAVLGLAGAYDAEGVRMHVELKSDPMRPELTADPELFTEMVIEELDRHGRLGNCAILSFDWRVIAHAAKIAPGTRRFALIELDTLHWNEGHRQRRRRAGRRARRRRHHALARARHGGRVADGAGVRRWARRGRLDGQRPGTRRQDAGPGGWPGSSPTTPTGCGSCGGSGGWSCRSRSPRSSPSASRASRCGGSRGAAARRS